MDATAPMPALAVTVSTVPDLSAQPLGLPPRPGDEQALRRIRPGNPGQRPAVSAFQSAI